MRIQETPYFYVHQSPDIGVWKILETWPEMLELFQNKYMYADEVHKLQSEKRKCEWLAIRLLLKRLTGSETLIHYKDNGLPFLENSPYYISISHTRGYAALILSNYPNPGIDIEYRSERAWKLRKRFMNKEELDQLSMASPQSTFATLCWCAKETAFKALQENDVDFINHLHIFPFALSDRGVIALKETKTPNQEVYEIHYQTVNEFVLTWKE